MLRLMQEARDLEAGNDVSMKDVYEKLVFLEIEEPSGVTGSDKVKVIQGPRFMKTHIPFQHWQKNLSNNPNVKLIQTIRNPKDTLVSQYHHVRSDGMLGAFNGTWDQFFELVKQKKLPWGDYFEVTADWYKFNKDRKNSLILKYEDMKKDHRGHVIKIAKFIGYNLSDKAIDLIVENSTVKSAAKKFVEVMRDDGTWKSDRSHFIRKGVVGDWVNYFSKEQSEYVDAKCKEVLEPLGLTFEYSG